MKSYARDITVTLIVKAILLFLLWYFCVRGAHPTLPSATEWMLGKEERLGTVSHSTVLAK